MRLKRKSRKQLVLLLQSFIITLLHVTVYFLYPLIKHRKTISDNKLFSINLITNCCWICMKICQSYRYFYRLQKILCKNYYVRRPFILLFLHLQVFSFLWHYNLFCYIMKIYRLLQFITEFSSFWFEMKTSSNNCIHFYYIIRSPES